MCTCMVVAQNHRARVTQVLVSGSMNQGAILVHVFDPQPYLARHGRPADKGYQASTSKGSALLPFFGGGFPY